MPRVFEAETGTGPCRRLVAAAFASIAVLGGSIEAAFAAPPARPPLQATAVDGPPLHRVAVFGIDERVRVPKRLEALKGSIGLIYNERSRTICSAFCVADDVLATASHCVFRTKGEAPPPADKFYFARPGMQLPSVRFAGATTRASAQQMIAGAIGISTKPPIEASKDWALVKLQGPACKGKALPVATMSAAEVEGEAAAGRLYQAAFHRDWGKWTLAYSQPCHAGKRVSELPDHPRINERDFSDPANLLLHTCDTGGASSGSPLLIETAEGPKVVAINVGTFVQARVMIQEGVVVKRAPASPVANTAVSALAFVSRLEPFKAAEILTSPADIRSIQRSLSAAGVLHGALDGKFDQRTRMAIEEYELRAGLTRLGLPTRALLDGMQRRAQ